MEFSPSEQLHLAAIRDKLDQMKGLLNSISLDPTVSLDDWHQCLSSMKSIVGNAHMDMNTIACILAKDYLCHKLPMQLYDAMKKPHGAAGLDIDEQTTNGSRVIGEIKTTGAFGHSDIRQPQKEAIQKDLERLNTTQAAFKFFFVVDPDIFRILKSKYVGWLGVVTLVLLPSGEEFLPN